MFHRTYQAKEEGGNEVSNESKRYDKKGRAGDLTPQKVP